MKHSEKSQAPELAELCDQCGTTIPRDHAIRGLAPDSSAFAADTPERDGLRLLTTCSPAHLEALQKQYLQRPFIKEELWSAKIARVLRQHPAGLTEQQLTTASGLSLRQIDHTLAWHRKPRPPTPITLDAGGVHADAINRLPSGLCCPPARGNRR